MLSHLRALSLTEAHQESGISVRMLKKLIDEGKLAGNKVGRKYIVSAQSLAEFVNHKPAPPARPTVAEERHFPEVEDRFA